MDLVPIGSNCNAGGNAGGNANRDGLRYQGCGIGVEKKCKNYSGGTVRLGFFLVHRMFYVQHCWCVVVRLAPSPLLCVDAAKAVVVAAAVSSIVLDSPEDQPASVDGFSMRYPHDSLVAEVWNVPERDADL